ncbi:unnamed protein product [Urochloa humidicola]
MEILEAMKILDLPLLGVFVAYLKARWTDRSRVDQRRRRLRQLVSMVRAVTDTADTGAGAAAVRNGSLSAWLNLLRAEALRGQEVLDAAGCDASAVAGSARRFVSGLRSLLVCSAELDRLTEAVEVLESLAGGGDLATFIKILKLEDARPRAGAAMMEIDARPGGARRRQEASGATAESVASGGGLPVPGAKRKRGPCGSAADASGAPDVAERHKRRALPWMRPHQWLPSGFFLGRPPPPPQPPVPASRPDRTREVALAMARVRRRIGKPTRRRRQPSLGQHFSRISL